MTANADEVIRLYLTRHRVDQAKRSLMEIPDKITLAVYKDAHRQFREAYESISSGTVIRMNELAEEMAEVREISDGDWDE